MDIKRFWWLLSLRGAILALLALFIFAYERTELVFNYWGISMLLVGGATLFYANRLRVSSFSWFFPLILGIFDLLLALVVLIYTNEFIQIFRMIVGAWAVGIGFLLIFMAMKNDSQKWILLINGMLSVALGVIIIINPFGEDGRIDNILLGVYSLALGAYLILLAFRLRPTAEDVPMEIEAPEEED
jgi:uncharacterized membrane protein HdeD (DUF308 family)